MIITICGYTTCVKWLYSDAFNIISFTIFGNFTDNTYSELLFAVFIVAFEKFYIVIYFIDHTYRPHVTLITARAQPQIVTSGLKYMFP